MAPSRVQRASAPAGEAAGFPDPAGTGGEPNLWDLVDRVSAPEGATSGLPLARSSRPHSDRPEPTVRETAAPTAREAAPTSGGPGLSLPLQRRSASGAELPERVRRQAPGEELPVPGPTVGGSPGPVVEEAPRRVTEQLEPWEIEFLAGKVYAFIKQKLAIEQERYGRPGYSLWS